MRMADAITLFRTLLVFPIAYLIIIKFNPILTIFLIIIMFILDAIDGYAAVVEATKGNYSLFEYLRATVLRDEKAKARLRELKSKLKGLSKHGSRLDVAGDRVTEYVFWITFTYLNVIPLFVIFLVVLRHSFVDAIMGSKGTSSKLKTKFARLVYGSDLSRSTIGALKVITFSYLVLVYVSRFPIVIGYILVALLVGYILLRGIAEFYESTKSE